MKTQLKNRMTMSAAALLLAGLALSAAGCTKTSTAAGSPPPPDVEIAVVEQKDIPIVREWIGTLAGMVNADIKAEVTGYLMKQNYAEGSFVRKGQLLFEIDPRPLQAALDQAVGQLAQATAQVSQSQAGLAQAQAQLLSAEANQRKAQMDEDKYAPLAEQQAVTQQDIDNARQTNRSAQAQVAANQAQVETAKAQIASAQAGVKAAEAAVQTTKVNLEFTKLTSPIDGIAGTATVQVGNLVGQSSSAITTVSTLDPIKATFTVGEQEYISLTRSDSQLQRMQLELILADGSLYPQKGRFSFADREVNQSTGAIQLTGLFPNSGNKLRPGQYAKVRATIGVQAGALLVPQRSVTETQGTYLAAVVDPNNTIRFAPVKVGERIGSDWVIDDGLKPGERVVTDGLFKIRPGGLVNPLVSLHSSRQGAK